MKKTLPTLVVATVLGCAPLSEKALLADTLPDHIIFRTAQTVSTGLGGLPAMDARCQAKAEAAALDGTWLAILSDSTANARDRLAAAGADGPFFNTYAQGSQHVATDLDDLFDGLLSATLYFNEFGTTEQSDSSTWTATLADGTYAGSSYGDWTSFSGSARVGRQLSTDFQWLNWFQQSGVKSANLYCVRTDRNPLFTPPPPPDFVHTIFVSSVSFDGNFGGLSGADADCQQLAAAAGMGDRPWRAVLSDSATDARDRLTISGPVFNTTGDFVAEDFEDLFDGGNAAFVRFDENGTLRNDQQVWTGSHPNGTRYSAGGPSAYKQDWTSSFGSTMLGGSTKMRADWLTWTTSFPSGGSFPARLHCIDQEAPGPILGLICPAGAADDYILRPANFDFVAIAGAGGELALSSGETTAVSLPFPFLYFGSEYIEVHVGSNGTLRFDAGSIGLENACLPEPAPDAPDVAVFWDALDVDSGGGVYTLDDSDNGRFIISWEDVPHASCAGAISAQIHLLQNGRIEFHWDDTTFGDPACDDGASATIGIQNHVGGVVGADDSFSVSCDTAVSLEGRAISFDNGCPRPDFENDPDFEFLGFAQQATEAEAVASEAQSTIPPPPDPEVEDPETADDTAIIITPGGEIYRQKLPSNLAEIVEFFEEFAGSSPGTSGPDGGDQEGAVIPQFLSEVDKAILGSTDDRRLRSGVSGFNMKKHPQRIVTALRYFSVDQNGNVQVSSSARCSGMMIGPRHVLTAGHCIWTGGTGGRFINRLVSPGREGNQESPRSVNGSYWPYWYWVSPEWYEKGASRWYKDYAIIVLQDTRGATTHGWFGRRVDSALAGDTIWNWGYPLEGQDCSASPTDGDCDGYMYGLSATVRRTSANVVFHRADTSGGHSGSPLYKWFSSTDRRVIGVHNYAINSVENAGSKMTNQMYDRISACLATFPSSYRN